MKRIFILAFGFYVAEAFSQVCNDPVLDAYQKREQIELEKRKLLIEERKLFLSSFERSHITQENARELGNRILDQLEDYPKGNKSRHRAQDLALLMETIATIQSDSR